MVSPALGAGSGPQEGRARRSVLFPSLIASWGHGQCGKAWAASGPRARAVRRTPATSGRGLPTAREPTPSPRSHSAPRGPRGCTRLLRVGTPITSTLSTQQCRAHARLFPCTWPF